MTDQEIDYSRGRFEEEKRDFEKQLDIISNPPLDSLLDLYHFADITIPKYSTERYVHGIDLLNALICYNNIVSLHYACVQCAEQSIIPLVTLLDEGADINMCNESGVTAFEYFAKCERKTNRINEIVRYFFKFVHRLIAIGLDSHEQNRRQYDIVCSREDMKHFIGQQLKISYDDELNKMADVKLKDQYTLRDVLNKDFDLTPFMSKIKKMMKDDSFQNRFPRLWCLVKLRYKQIITRNEWKPLVNDALKMLARRKLPQNCVELIIEGLQNYDLANLLTVAFNICLQNYKIARNRRNSNRLSIPRSPKKMLLPRI